MQQHTAPVRLCRAHAWIAGLAAGAMSAVGAGDPASVPDYLAAVHAVIGTLDRALQQAADRYQQAGASMAESPENDEEQRKANYRADFEQRQAHYRELAWAYRHAARSLGPVNTPAPAATSHRQLIDALEQHAQYYADVAAGMDATPFELRGYFSRETTVPQMEELREALAAPLRALNSLAD